MNVRRGASGVSVLLVCVVLLLTSIEVGLSQRCEASDAMAELRNPDSLVRKEAANALRRIALEGGSDGSTPDVSAIVSALRDALSVERDSRAAIAMTNALRMIGEAAGDAVPELVMMLAEDDTSLRWAATRALARIEPQADQAEALLGVLSDSERHIYVRLRAAQALEILAGDDPHAREEAVTLLLELATDRNLDMSVRLLAAERLREMSTGNSRIEAALSSLNQEEYIEVYPGPGGDAYRSDLYKVEVFDGIEWVDSYTYKMSRKSVTLWHRGAYPSVNFTTFGTVGDAIVRVSKLHGEIDSIEISPKSKRIQASLINGMAVFVLKKNYKVWVTIDKDDANPLFIFADAPRPAVPPGAVYFGPGVHDIGHLWKATSGQVIYLDGGAWVTGNIDVRGTSNVTIMGPGVLSGEKWTGEEVNKLEFEKAKDYFMIVGDPGTRGCSVDGITIVNSPMYCTYQLQHYYSVKLLSPWYWSTDGFYTHPRPGEDATANECFAFIGDDVFFPRDNILGNVIIENSFVGCTNNNVFQMSYWARELDHNFTTIVRNIDVKTYNEHGVFLAVLDSRGSAPDKGTKNQLFENIRIEGNVDCPLIWIQNRPYPWGDGSGIYDGNSYNIVFRNITLEGTQKGKSRILGKDEANGHHDYLIENLSINGEYVTEANKAEYFDINEWTSNIRFVVSAESSMDSDR